MSSTVFVQVIVRDANGEDANIIVKDFIRVGQTIPERITTVAGEAAGMALIDLKLRREAKPETPTIRDRTH